MDCRAHMKTRRQLTGVNSLLPCRDQTQVTKLVASTLTLWTIISPALLLDLYERCSLHTSGVELGMRLGTVVSSPPNATGFLLHLTLCSGEWCCGAAPRRSSVYRGFSWNSYSTVSHRRPCSLSRLMTVPLWIIEGGTVKTPHSSLWAPGRIPLIV